MVRAKWLMPISAMSAALPARSIYTLAKKRLSLTFQKPKPSIVWWTSSKSTANGSSLKRRRNKNWWRRFNYRLRLDLFWKFGAEFRFRKLPGLFEESHPTILVTVPEFQRSLVEIKALLHFNLFR